MDVREYNEQEAKIMLIFLQNQNPNNKKLNLQECATPPPTV